MIVVLLRPPMHATNGARRISVGEWRGSRVLRGGKVEKRQLVAACCTSVELLKGLLATPPHDREGKGLKGLRTQVNSCAPMVLNCRHV